jgi:ketosteroid isomerase-like protein
MNLLQHFDEIVSLGSSTAGSHGGWTMSIHPIVSRIRQASAGLATLLLGCAGHQAKTAPDAVPLLIQRSKDSNAALMRGDIEHYQQLLQIAPDFTLMSPFGGEPSRAPTPEVMQRMGRFFKNGTLEQELVQAYGSPDMVALAIIERATVEVGGLSRQPWALRVTLVYRRDGADWRLVHRHADPLVEGISLPRAAQLARGERPEE